MTIGEPRLLIVFIILPLALLFVWWAGRRRQELLARIGELPLMLQLSARVNWNGRLWQTRLWFVILLLLLVGLIRPQWGSQEQVIEQEGIQLMVVLDVSQSMLAADLRPDRLTRAKLEIIDLMSRLNGDEIGLVLFSGASFVQFPLTSDYSTARRFLENANPGLISRQGTNLSAAIRTALNAFDNQRPNQRVMLILSDGEEHEADPLPLAAEAAQLGVIIYTIGIGSAEGEPVPEYNEEGELVDFKRDGNGEIVLSQLDEATMAAIATAGNGRYFPLTATGTELDLLVEELDLLQTERSERVLEVNRIERFQIFLLLAVLLFVIMELIPDKRKTAVYMAER